MRLCPPIWPGSDWVKRLRAQKAGLAGGKLFFYLSIIAKQALVGRDAMKQFGRELLAERLALAVGNAHIAGQLDDAAPDRFLGFAIEQHDG